MKAASMTPTEFWNQHGFNHDAKLIDISEPADFEQLHASGSVCFSPQEVVKIATHAKADNTQLYLISRQGHYAASLGEELERRGCDNIVLIAGGTEAWAASRLPICHGHTFHENNLCLIAALIIVGGIVMVIADPRLYMLPVLGIAAFIAVSLVLWADTIGNKRVSNLPQNSLHASMSEQQQTNQR
jgi:rhodanese-related sulfurtransferase